MTAMTAQEQFRVGFLMRCAEDGCTLEDISQRIKQANPFFMGAGIGGGQAVVGGLSNLKELFYDYMKSPAYIAGVGIPLAAAAGGALGHGAGIVQSQDADPAELKRQELLQAYKVQAARIKQLAAANKPDKGIRSPRLLQ
jgi:hypothetical protein